MGQVFVYSGNEEKREKIRQTAAETGVGLKDLQPKDLGAAIGYIVGLSDKNERDASVPPLYNMPEVMLFAGLPNEQLDVFLAAYKRNGIEPVYLKAVVTPFNAAWSLYRLIEELKREHAEMKRLFSEKGK